MKKQISLRWKLLFYILIFSVGLFFLLWLFQTVFLDQFYQNIRENQIQKAAGIIKVNIDDKENLSMIMNRQAVDNEACIRVIYDYNQTILAGNQMGCAVDQLSQEDVNYLYSKALQNHGSWLEKVYFHSRYSTLIGEVNHRFEDIYDLVLTTIVETENGNPALILISARLTPVNATVSTLQLQLGYIAIILFLLALILTYIMTDRIVKPLEKISDGAKELAGGNYDVSFKAEGFREINELNDTMNYASKKLKEVDQIRRDLIANVSHDLRTPLTMIAGYGEVMRDIPNENTQENAQIIIDETQRLTELINDLLDLSKLQENKIVLHKRRTNMTQLIEKTCERYKVNLEKNQIKMIFEYEKEEMVLIDEARIQQVLDNFINNAIHYCGQNRLIILRQQSKDHDVRIEVQDFGEGILEEKLDYIWDRYYKIDKTHVRSETGSGVGLSIVKEILSLHEVNFGVISKPNEGSLFYFELERV